MNLRQLLDQTYLLIVPVKPKPTHIPIINYRQTPMFLA
jgi:hypothetical protein